MTRDNRIAIVGAGDVGATCAYAALIRGVARHIALYDIDKAKVRAQVLDLNHGLQFVPAATVDGGDDIEICRDASIIVITAGAKQKPGQTRLDLAAANASLCAKLIPDLMRVAPNAILLLVTNPVDVITYIAMKLSGLPRPRVFGSGTVLDSSRFRFLIARHCGVAVQNVHAYIAGEHGDSEIPLWSSASIGSVPLDRWNSPGHGRLTGDTREAIFQDVRTAAYQIVQGKGATHYAIGLATTRILEAVLGNENRILPVSSLIDGPAGGGAGLRDVCLSLPCIVNRDGVGSVLDIPMNDTELAGLRQSADTIRAVIRSLGY